MKREEYEINERKSYPIADIFVFDFGYESDENDEKDKNY